jgi:RNA polymerase sigma-70 factor (ECF subfamily)
LDTRYVSERATTFSELYGKYAPDVFRYALYLSGNRSAAEDITSETFVRIWGSPEPPRQATVRAYLMTIARNLYLHDRRRTQRQSEMPEQVPAPGSLSGDTESREELARVLATLQELPEVDRTALLLRADEGLSYEEIAAMLRIPVSTAKVKVYRARLYLAARHPRSPVCPKS